MFLTVIRLVLAESRRHGASSVLGLVSVLVLLLQFKLIAMGLLGPESAGVGEYLSFVSTGFAVWFLFFALTGSMLTRLMDELKMGTFERIIASPTDESLYFLAVSTAYSLVALLLTTIILASSTLFGATYRLNITSTVAVLLASLTSFYGIGLMMLALAITSKQATQILALVQAILLVLSGIYYPVGVLPTYLKVVAQAIPLTWSIQGFREALSGTPLEELTLTLTVLAAMGFIYLIAGLISFRKALNRERIRGTVLFW